MFGFLIKDEVNDDAARLKILADLTVSKYCSKPFSEACSVVMKDFNEHLRYSDRSECSFVYENLPEFHFYLRGDFKNGQLSLTVHGHGKYEGFMLQTIDGGQKWHALLSKGLTTRPTGGAKKMIQVMEKKYNATDLSIYSMS